jgi:ATP-dependent DNA helicase RecG
MENRQLSFFDLYEHPFISTIENAGSGVNKIIYGWEYAQWRRPYLIIESQPDRLILDLPKFNILPEETLHSLRELFGEKVDALGKDELNILAICHIEGEVNNNRLQDSINKHRTDITKILQELCKEGFMLSENKSRWTTYHLNMEYGNDVKLDTKVGSSNQKVGTSKQKIGSSETLTPNLDTSMQEVDTFGSNMDTSESNVDSSKQKVDTSETLTPNLDTSMQKVDTFGSNMDTSESNVDSSKQKVDTSETLTPNLDTSMQKVDTSNKTKSKKLSKEQLNILIIKSCKAKYMTIEQIALTVNRSPGYLQNEVLPNLVSNAKLERLFPDNPNHPNQAYKAAKKIK